MELIDIEGDMQPSKVFVGRLILPQTVEISDRGVPDTILIASAFLLRRSEYLRQSLKIQNQCAKKRLLRSR